jgi:hypothetical protein
MIPQSFAAGENRSYPEFWIVTDNPLYPGYKTLTSLFQDISKTIRENEIHLLIQNIAYLSNTEALLS